MFLKTWQLCFFVSVSLSLASLGISTADPLAALAFASCPLLTFHQQVRATALFGLQLIEVCCLPETSCTLLLGKLASLGSLLPKQSLCVY